METDKTKKFVCLDGNDTIEGKRIKPKGNQERDLSLDDVKLSVEMRLGDVMDVDVSCDSKHMKQAMRRVGQAIRDCFHWVPRTIIMCLVMDNAGGHGTDETVAEHTRMLKDDFNIKVHHQRPCSPETNACDLGFWMSLQSLVEKLHYEQRTDNDALARTVLNAWRDYPGEKLTKIFNRIPEVSRLTIEDGGDNRKVESRHGLTRDPALGE